MRGYWGEDTLLGGAGGDLFIAGADLVIGGDLDTTNDVDTVSYAEMDGAVRVTLAIFFQNAALLHKSADGIHCMNPA
ncbi:hypothetical protein ABMC88_11175 [Sulfitobacter sp. HNIBRBA2951]|uniref:hypothetical protein n=1 Tax=Sulfitobacter aquimarinus TaxID=3158557 RepID=UPI0032DE58AB